MELFLEKDLETYRIGGFLWFVFVLPLYVRLKPVLHMNSDVKQNASLERLTNSSVFLQDTDTERRPNHSTVLSLPSNVNTDLTVNRSCKGYIAYMIQTTVICTEVRKKCYPDY